MYDVILQPTLESELPHFLPPKGGVEASLTCCLAHTVTCSSGCSVHRPYTAHVRSAQVVISGVWFLLSILEALWYRKVSFGAEFSGIKKCLLLSITTMVINPRRACTMRVTVLWSVCVCISPMEHLFMLSRTQQARNVKQVVEICLKPLRSRVMPRNMSKKANALIIFQLTTLDTQRSARGYPKSALALYTIAVCAKGFAL